MNIFDDTIKPQPMRLFIISLICVIYGCTNNNGDKFLGEWTNLQYRGKSSEKISIVKNGDGYLVEFKRKIDAGNGFYDGDGSFKETAIFKDNSLVVNERTKLSLISDGSKILMNGDEFVKRNSSSANSDKLIGTWIPAANGHGEELTVSKGNNGYTVRYFEKDFMDETYEGIDEDGIISYEYMLDDAKMHTAKLSLQGDQLIDKTEYGDAIYKRK